jgi:hypothetical protein
MLSAAFAIFLSAVTQEMVVPEGTILPVVLNETISTARLEENEPIRFALAEDIRSGHRTGAVLLPRGSSVVGRVLVLGRAGHLIGRSRLDIRIQQIITPTGEIYEGLSTKIVGIGNTKGQKGGVELNAGIQGSVHRKRDTLLLLFPPTMLIQIIETPKRGPDVVLPAETRLYLKLLMPILIESLPASGSPVPPTLNRNR